MIIKTIITTISLIVILFIPAPVISANLDWLLNCFNDGNDFDYYKEIDKLKNGAMPQKVITAELNRQLPKINLGDNCVCIYEPILYFGDASTIRHFKERAQKTLPYDRPGYASDIFKLLTSRSSQFKTKDIFMKELNSFNKPTTIRYFLDAHLQDLTFQSRMDVMTDIINERKLPGHHHYAVPEILRKLYVENPAAYDEFLTSLPNIADEFTCFKEQTCP